MEITKITKLQWKRFNIRVTPISNSTKIDGASVIQKLHIPGFCCEIHYTHARYIYSTENLNFCVGRGVLTPFQWGCHCKNAFLDFLKTYLFECFIKAFFLKMGWDFQWCCDWNYGARYKKCIHLKFLKPFSFKLLGAFFKFQSERPV